MFRYLNPFLKASTVATKTPLRRFSIIRSDFEALPIFDLSELTSTDKKTRDYSIDRLRRICHQVGFFYIKNHGINELMKQMLTVTESFFDLPQAEKDKMKITFSPHYRGYGKLGGERTNGIQDKKETFDLGLEKPARNKLDVEQHPYLVLQGPNQWPTSSALDHMQWKQLVLSYISALQKIGGQLIAAMSTALGLPGNELGNQFCSSAEDAHAMLRLLRYPPGRESELGVGPHVDAGGLIILLQDETGGLQVQNCQGKWVDAPHLPNTFVVNMGEMLQILSNNYFQATRHRVINTSARIRHSVPFFYEPDLTAVIRPLNINPELLKDIKPFPIQKNNPVVYGEHMLEIFRRSFSSEPEPVRPRL